MLQRRENTADGFSYRGEIETISIRRLLLLWEILVEIDLEDTGALEEKVLEYGSCLDEENRLGRRIFMRMVSVMQRLKKG